MKTGTSSIKDVDAIERRDAKFVLSLNSLTGGPNGGRERGGRGWSLGVAHIVKDVFSGPNTGCALQDTDEA